MLRLARASVLLLLPRRIVVDYDAGSSTDNDAPDQEEETRRQQYMKPSGRFERNCSNRPDDEHEYGADYSKVHDLTSL
jgi:hypothetical protein